MATFSRACFKTGDTPERNTTMIYLRSFDIQPLFESRTLLLPAHTTKEDLEQYLARRTEAEIPPVEPDELGDENEWLQQAMLRRPIF